ncbi:hypothetical protein SAMN04488077_11379 [Roseovarius tolerans]|uniref:Transmembrane protein (PGPGW) n=1 Tax=Roseovarius tolerans TaxID=74031 RepID=A0A1H8ELD8_9RHOB|nr:hypothetical protein [Roseovarius tolerans]SEN20401.1 hypothetical protein SAMN04488077_11379 [Roseovarius tolerans]
MPEQDQRPEPYAKGKLRQWRRRVQLWTGRNLPPGLRLVAGLLLICGGFLGFLPVLGFWMIPLGLAVAALDVVPLWRWLRGRRR